MRPLFALLPLAITLSLSAQEAVAPRLAIFWPDRIVSKSPRAKKLFSELDVVGKSLQDKIEAKGLEGQKLQSQLQSPSISDAGREQITKQLRDLEYDFKKLQEDSKTDFSKLQKKIFSQFQAEIGPIVDAVAKEQKLQVVLQYQQGLIAFADDAWLGAFNDEVAKRYETMPAAAAAPAPKPAAKSTPVKK